MNKGNLCPQVSNLGSAWALPFEKHRDFFDTMNLTIVRSLC